MMASALAEAAEILYGQALDEKINQLHQIGDVISDGSHRMGPYE